jgi:ribosomal protein L27
LVIKVNRLDTLLSNRLKKENRFFIKMDIEGHEIEALEGCKELLAEPNVTFLVEINEKGKHIETIFKKMKELGYKIYEKIPVTPGDQFLRERFIDGSNLAFVSDDFLFIKSSEVVRLFERHIQEKSL